MEASRSLTKPNKQSLSRGAKVEPSDGPIRETLTQKENSRSVTHHRDLLPATEDGCSAESRVPQDRRRGRSSRLVRPAGRQSSQDGVKGKVPHPSNTGTSSPEEAPTQQNQRPILGPAEEASRGDASDVFLEEDGFLHLRLTDVSVVLEIHLTVEEDPEGKPTMDDRPLTEQQLGLRQAEERLRRDYIHRLLKVRRVGPAAVLLVASDIRLSAVQ